MKNYFYGLRLFCRAGLLVSAAFLLILTGCTVSESEAGKTTPIRGQVQRNGAAVNGALTLMTWNVHNLCDGVDDGFEYDEFTQAAGWTAEKYNNRLIAVSAAIKKISPKPDIIVLQEVESLKVLKDLAAFLERGYSWSRFANNHGAAVGLGILSRLPLSEEKTHSINIDGETTPRPVLEARVNAEENAFVIFACHWKSKLGGADVTESIRRASARVILRRMRELWEDEPQLGMIIAGDLNENYDEFYRQGSSKVCALLPDDPLCADLTGSGSNWRQKDFFILSGEKPPASAFFPDGAVVLYSPWINELSNGSYYYKNNPETIDHFLVSTQFFDDTGWEYEKVFIADTEPFAYDGIPVPYNSRTGSGYSDHLPLILRINKSD